MKEHDGGLEGGVGSEMLSWLRRRCERVEQIETEAYALIYDFAIEAYAEARQREREANDLASMRYWSRVALAIARKIDKRIGLDGAARTPADTGFLSYAEKSAPQTGRLNEPRPIVSNEPPPQFRLQFLARTPDNETTIAEEVAVSALDAATAIRQAIRTRLA